MEKYTRLKNGYTIGTAALEIKMIPSSEILAEEPSEALKKKIALFSELLNLTAHGAKLQDTVLELLFISVPVSGQAYEAQIRPFIILRKFGQSPSTIEPSLQSFTRSSTASLQSLSYVVEESSQSFSNLNMLLETIDEASILSLEKQVRVGSFSAQSGYVCYVNSYRLDAPDNLSRVFDAMSHHPGMALSFQLMPTSFIQNEISFIQGINMFLEIPGPHNRPGGEAGDAVKYYENLKEVLDKQQFLYNITLVGPQEAALQVGNRLLSTLQREDGKVGLTLANRREDLPPFAKSFAMYPWNMITRKTQKPLKGEITPAHFSRMVHIISEAEAMTFFHMPIDNGNISGIPVNRIRVSRETFAGGIADGTGIRLGKLMGSGTDVPFTAPLKGFTRHALVVGMPGTGKTTFSVNLLLQFYKRGIPFLAIEPTKSEYRAMIDAIPNLQVFTPGKNSVVPFIINPFLPPEGITLETFKPSLISAFKAAFSMPSPLDILFANAIDACYIKNGWRNYSKLGDPDTKPFSLQEFVITFRELIRNSNYSAESKGNMESAGVFRLLNLIIQNGNIYDTENSVPLQDLLRKPTIIELNAIDNQEQKALLMALLLINIVLFTKHNQAGDGNLKNIMLIDEAHVLLGGSTSPATEGAAEAGASTVRALQNMIVEIRSYGTGIIIADQSPQKVTKEIVGNTDVKVMFQLVQAEDKNIIAASSNMKEADMNNLSRLNTGEAYVYLRGLVEPVRIMTEDIREKENIRLVVSDHELSERMHYWDDRQELLKPYHQCKICPVCAACDFKLRDDAKYYVDQLFIKDKPRIKDKQSLFALVVPIENRLREFVTDYSGEKFRQLLYCVCVRYIRKAALETPVILSDTETTRVLNKVMEYPLTPISANLPRQ